MNARNVAAGAIAGTAAAVSYLVAMKADLAILKSNTDDRVLLGYPLVREVERARKVGMILHVINGAMIGVAYSTIGRRVLPGPDWLRGVLYANLENAALYPLAKLESRHPAIRDRALDRYWTPTAFFQSMSRHVAFGAVVGYVERRLRSA